MRPSARRPPLPRAWHLGAAVAAGIAVASIPAQAQPAAAQSNGATRAVPSAPALPVADDATTRITVVRAPVPPAIRAAALGATAPWWRAVAGPGMRLIGPDSGRIAPGDSLVRLVLHQGATVRGGRHLGAIVRMGVPAHTASGAGAPPTGRGPGAADPQVEVVRLPLEVPVRRQLALLLPPAPLPVQRGRWNTLPLTLENRGNTSDAVRLQLVLPPTWRRADDHATPAVTVHPGMSAVRPVRVWIPANTPTGQQAIAVRVATTARPAGSGDTLSSLRLDVRDGPGPRPGPRLELTTMAVRAADGSTAAGGALVLAGPLSDGLTVDGRVAVGGSRNPGADWGLARSGLLSAPPTVTLTGTHAALSIGNVPGTGSLLAGALLAGVGGAARWTPANRRAELFAARPVSFAGTRPGAAGTGRFLGAAVQQQWGTLQVGVEGAHLRDPLAGRALDVGILSTARTSTGAAEAVSDIAGALAWRRYAQGQGLGAQGSYRRTGRASSLELRAVHAPGGSAAFARAARELGLTASRQLRGGASMAGGAWAQQDRGGVLGRLRSQGWYLMPSLPLGRRRAALASLELRDASLRSTGPGGALATRERQLVLLVGTQRGGTQLGVRAALAAVERAVGVDAHALVPGAGRRVEWRATAAQGLPGGARAEGSWSWQGGAGDAGVVPRQQALLARVERLPVPGAARLGITMEGDAQWLATPGAAAVWGARAGLRLPLPAGGALVLQAERAPFLAAPRGGGLLVSLRLEQRAGLRAPGGTRTRVVFADDNGNGRRDAGEAGVPGIIVRCGDASLVSDAAGRVRCPAVDATGDDAWQVDARTLPAGYLAPRATARAARMGDALGLRPVRALHVQLVPAADSFRVRPADLARAVVTARSADSTRWVARGVGDGRFVFDALPPGRYQLEVDLLDVPEPLLLEEPLPLFTVSPSAAVPPVRITVHPRPLRFTPPGPAPRARAMRGSP